MFSRPKRPDMAEICTTGLRHDLWQNGASAEICHEIASIRHRHDVEALTRNRHLARDVGLLR